jgi:hypothetical protein
VVSFPQVSPPKPCIHLSLLPIRAICPAHLILLDFITRTIFGEEYRSLSYSLCIFLHSPISLSLLGTNILLCKYKLYQIYLNIVYTNQPTNQHKTYTPTYINTHSEVGAHMY